MHLLLEVSEAPDVGARSVGRAAREPERLLRERVLRRLVQEPVDVLDANVGYVGNRVLIADGALLKMTHLLAPSVG